jgi:hypothetical protein
MCNKYPTIRRGSIQLKKNRFRLFLRGWSFDYSFALSPLIKQYPDE